MADVELRRHPPFELWANAPFAHSWTLRCRCGIAAMPQDLSLTLIDFILHVQQHHPRGYP